MTVRQSARKQAQENIMHSLAFNLLRAEEDGTDDMIVDEMRRQSARIGRWLGYASWPGIFNDRVRS